jgi:hypothetical protein
MVGPGVPGFAASALGHDDALLLPGSLDAAAGAVITGNGLSHAAVKATEAAAA